MKHWRQTLTWWHRCYSINRHPSVWSCLRAQERMTAPPLLGRMKQDSVFFLFFFFNFYFLNFKIFNSYMRSQTWTPLPPPSPQHLSGSSPCPSPKHAAPYVRYGLAIQFLHDSIHVRIPILPNHPTLSLSLWVQKSVIHIRVFFPVLHTGSSLPSS